MQKEAGVKQIVPLRLRMLRLLVWRRSKRSLFRLEGEVEPRAVLERQRASLAVSLSLSDDVRRTETEHFEVILKLLRVPYLPMLLLKVLSRTGLSIDLGDQSFSWIDHVSLIQGKGSDCDALIAGIA